MKRGGPALAILLLASCAAARGPAGAAWMREESGFPPGDGRRPICVGAVAFEGDAYGKAAFFSGMREAFAETEFPLERRGAGPDEWVPAGEIDNRYRLAACDGAAGAGRMEITLGLTSPMFEREVATPWGATYRLAGVRCRLSLRSPDMAAGSVYADRFAVFYRAWTTRDPLTAEMGRQLGEVLLAHLHRRAGALAPDTRIAPPDAMDWASW